MPNIIDIKTSIEYKILIKDEFISKGEFERTPNGDLKCYSGGYTAVFPVVVNREKWAFRCWHADLGNVRKRFNLISNDLKNNPLPYFCNFNYTDEGIVVDGKIYPTTRMKWVEGLNLIDFIFNHRMDKDALNNLAQKFLEMCQVLHKNNIAHGDLQHGNIIVSDTGDLYLVDYDSLYTPSIAGFTDLISGLKNYQHPERRNNKMASEKLDYFSELIIYLGILSIAKNPSLAEKYDIRNTETLLFDAEDFIDITHSEIYQDISSFGGRYHILLKVLEIYLSKSSIDELEPFDVIEDRLLFPPLINEFSSDNGHIILKGEKVSLHWKIENLTNLFINEKEISVNDTSFEENSLEKGIKVYTLKVINGLKTITESISIETVERPNISFSLSNKKIKRGKEQSELNWIVSNASSVEIKSNNGSVNEKNLKGRLLLNPSNTTEYYIYVTALDKKTIYSQKLTLYVFDESKSNFKADKYFVFPNIPVILSWWTKDAKKVELSGFGKVDFQGIKIIEVSKDTIFELKVTDNFEVKTLKVEIRMLPIPLVKSLTVPMPDINTKINVQVYEPKFNIHITPPEIKHLGIGIKAPFSLSLDKMDLKVKDPETISLKFDLPQETCWWNRIGEKYNEIKTKIMKSI